ncbi:MAG: hypothetical protein F6K54_18005 [Okeania sp. SIO3B5]|uniref:hypothetical protein n=1 Tax=Okeania sp. SIO3B5 TaxID=2607811 RepID=UPI001400D2CE|nr:hypothetical protein [Okeania sp. SIO3B5]NEO54808.1 hypothetical protein [Okeania sp. SIO3B5]
MGRWGDGEMGRFEYSSLNRIMNILYARILTSSKNFHNYNVAVWGKTPHIKFGGMGRWGDGEMGRWGDLNIQV